MTQRVGRQAEWGRLAQHHVFYESDNSIIVNGAVIQSLDGDRQQRNQEKIDETYTPLHPAQSVSERKRLSQGRVYRCVFGVGCVYKSTCVSLVCVCLVCVHTCLVLYCSKSGCLFERKYSIYIVRYEMADLSCFLGLM